MKTIIIIAIVAILGILGYFLIPCNKWDNVFPKNPPARTLSNPDAKTLLNISVFAGLLIVRLRVGHARHQSRTLRLRVAHKCAWAL